MCFRLSYPDNGEFFPSASLFEPIDVGNHPISPYIHSSMTSIHFLVVFVGYVEKIRTLRVFEKQLYVLLQFSLIAFQCKDIVCDPLITAHITMTIMSVSLWRTLPLWGGSVNDGKWDSIVASFSSGIGNLL
jgi:hypothetical protein